MNLTGDGFLGTTSRLDFNSYKVLATFTENPTIALQKFSVTADGSIDTQSGRTFNGTLVFDGNDASNSNMNGVLTGINDEPTINGIIKTSLSSKDITTWVSANNEINTGTLNDAGNQSYSMDVTITKPGKSVKANMLVQRDDTAKTWTYLMNNLLLSDANVNMSIDRVYLVQNGDNTLAKTFEKLAINGLGTNSDINAMVNFGWDVASDFSKIGIKGLNLTMKPASGDVAVKSTINVLNNGTTMSANMNTTYDYATTHLTTQGDFSTVVDSSSGTNSYTNTFTTAGVIKVDNKFNYNYAISYNDAVQDMLFTTADSSYQMGFRITNNAIIGGDSYGVLATFIMNDTYDVLENMQLQNNANELLGHYDHAKDKLQIMFADDTKEYMYLY
jgi:hypothetical protein